MSCYPILCGVLRDALWPAYRGREKARGKSDAKLSVNEMELQEAWLSYIYTQNEWQKFLYFQCSFRLTPLFVLFFVYMLPLLSLCLFIFLIPHLLTLLTAIQFI